MHQYQGFKEFERTQIATASGIGMALGGSKPITYESLQSGSAGRPSENSVETEDGQIVSVKKALQGFPNDVTYMNEDSIKTLLSMSNKGVKARPWDLKRAKAHRGDFGIAAKRCSVSQELWQKYLIYEQANKEVSLQLVKVWAEMEWISKILMPQTWDIARARKEKIDPAVLRSKKLGMELIQALTDRYKELMQIN